MQVIICGAGRVGQGIAERLAAEDNDVTVIDTSPQLIQNIRDTLDVRGFVGHGAHPDVLARAGAAEADMLVAVTLYDEVNMVACQLAHSVFNVPRKIARVRAQSYMLPEYKQLFSSDHMPIDVVISPELEVGRMVLRRIALPGATDAVRFAQNRVSMIAVECDEDCPLVNTPLEQLTELFPDLAATIVGVWRNNRMFTPHSSDQLRTGDLAYVIADREQVARVLGLFGHEETAAQRIILAGGGNIGLTVARALEERGSAVRVKIIEASRERAIGIADELKKTVVLHGDALDQDVVTEAGVENADLFVTLTNDDQVNILASVMAKRLGCKTNLALLNNPSYHGFTRTLGIDAFINPRTVTISKVLQYVRQGRVEAVHSIQAGAAEVMEAIALETSMLTSAPLRDLDLPEGVRIGAIFRDGKVIMPRGDVRVRTDDRIVVFAEARAVKQVERMFAVALSYAG